MADYFTKDTDNWIAKFNEEVDQRQKHIIFESYISPAFEKLIENLIYVYGFFSIDDVDTLKRDCLATLYESLPKFDPSRGSKGFSYFNVIAKNWFIHKSRERIKRGMLESELRDDIDKDVLRNNPHFSLDFEDEIDEKERWESFLVAMEKWKDKLQKKDEKKVLAGVILLLRNSDMVSIYNKKATYLYLREMTGLSTKQVVVHLKKIRAFYDEWRRGYLEGDEFGEDHPGSARECADG